MPETGTYFLQKELEGLEASFIARLKAFDGLSYSQRIALAIQVDFFQELQEAGLSSVLKKMLSEYGGIISQLEKMKPAGVQAYTLKELDIVANLDAEMILGHAKNYATQFKSELIKGYVGGEDYKTIAARLSESRLATNQIIAAVTTAKDTFRATSIAKLFEDEPDTRFILQGILDNRTRCSCKAVLLNQSKEGSTKAEIDLGVWTKIAKQHCPKFEGVYSFTFRGGFNCRHYPEII